MTAEGNTTIRRYCVILEAVRNSRTRPANITELPELLSRKADERPTAMRDRRHRRVAELTGDEGEQK